MNKYNKTLATYLALFLGLLGVHILYLKKSKIILCLHITLTILGAIGIYLFKFDNNSILVWILLCCGVFNWCIIWLSCIYYGLMPSEKWIIFAHSNEKNSQTNALTVLCIIIALMLGMGTLMAFLAFAFQSYFEYNLS